MSTLQNRSFHVRVNSVHPEATDVMRSLPPLASLRAFEAAGRLLSFQDAARELGLTPTAISHQVRLLEQSCGKPLFQRRPRPLSLTPAGATLLSRVSKGLDLFAEGFEAISDRQQQRLKVTATNAFAARWLMPRVPSWRALRPDIGLDIMGSDTVLDLVGGEVDVAIRYARQAPKGLVCSEIGRDNYLVVASPSLVGRGPLDFTPQDLSRYPLIDGQWTDDFLNPPMWFEWVRLARERWSDVPDLAGHASLSFREDLHGIEAAIAGYGIAICSDILVAPELASGALVRVSSLALEGYAFIAAHRPNHPRQQTIKAFEAWIAECFRAMMSTDHQRS
ncbi:LysR substrate-binding domain-containing protein [Tabrizicola oligotrophica]|nr:LysR substrate-binding domain-containing protein [Tabrizicola oligotrophica]